MLDVLGENGQISSEQKQKSIEWLQSNPVLIHSSLIDQYESIEPVKRIQVECASTKPIIVSGGEKTLLELADTAPHSIQRRLLQLIVEKQSNLCVSIDRTDSESVLDLIRLIGAHVVLIKLHADIITNFDDRFVQELRRLADQLRFLVFEDRKFADIGNTVRLQFSQGLHRIREWADIVNCHALPGAGVLDGIRAGLQDREVACLIVAQLSCKGNLITETYTKQAVAQAEANPDLVIGFISQERLSSNPHILHMTPGVHLDQDGDKLGQQYVTPADAVTQRGADLVIVGRGITESSDPVEAAIRYKQNAYEALEKRFQRISSSN